MSGAGSGGGRESAPFNVTHLLGWNGVHGWAATPLVPPEELELFLLSGFTEREVAENWQLLRSAAAALFNNTPAHSPPSRETFSRCCVAPRACVPAGDVAAVHAMLFLYAALTMPRPRGSTSSSGGVTGGGDCGGDGGGGGGGGSADVPLACLPPEVVFMVADAALGSCAQHLYVGLRSASDSTFSIDALPEGTDAFLTSHAMYRTWFSGAALSHLTHLKTDARGRHVAVMEEDVSDWPEESLWDHLLWLRTRAHPQFLEVRAMFRAGRFVHVAFDWPYGNVAQWPLRSSSGVSTTDFDRFFALEGAERDAPYEVQGISCSGPSRPRDP
eukprot:TRINITY_DN5492_c0_g1_i1.p1 TRINITY_DN5492_c0_g1~~TRINITY_DN5492_c0_g1_i1.p1  ORF type:complete len:329 (-),score=36.25 TRINITY_DN5492_c0_g1_i1:1090-2076(-)